MRTILITGGTGLVGKEIVKHLLAKNYRIIILTRDPAVRTENDGIEYAFWDPAKEIIDAEAVKKADAIIHLAGAGVMDKKWTDAYKKEIIESRTKSSELLIDTLRKNIHHVKVWVSASAIGWYGPDMIPGYAFTEEDKADPTFLGEVCRLWEESSKPAESLGIRVCRLRIGIVLAGKGGAYPQLRAPLKFGIASILGNGNQVVSWIQIDDLCRAFIFALENASMKGSYNAVAPDPVTNKMLTLVIAKKVKGKFFLPLHVPALILKLMLGSRSIEILKSTRVSARKIITQGFTFLYPGINTAIDAVENITDPTV